MHKVHAHVDVVSSNCNCKLVGINKTSIEGDLVPILYAFDAQGCGPVSIAVLLPAPPLRGHGTS